MRPHTGRPPRMPAAASCRRSYGGGVRTGSGCRVVWPPSRRAARARGLRPRRSRHGRARCRTGLPTATTWSPGRRIAGGARNRCGHARSSGSLTRPFEHGESFSGTRADDQPAGLSAAAGRGRTRICSAPRTTCRLARMGAVVDSHHLDCRYHGPVQAGLCGLLLFTTTPSTAPAEVPPQPQRAAMVQYLVRGGVRWRRRCPFRQLARRQAPPGARSRPAPAPAPAPGPPPPTARRGGAAPPGVGAGAPPLERQRASTGAGHQAPPLGRGRSAVRRAATHGLTELVNDEAHGTMIRHAPAGWSWRVAWAR